MDLDFTPDEEAFREEVRQFLAAELPDEIRQASAVNVSCFFETDISQPWHQILHRKGWAAPEWPVDRGGTGWSATQQYIWRIEAWRASAPIISQMAMRLVSPTILEFGTEEQKQRFLPDILSGKTYWCQGFSEPGAGSDLAALSCAAVLDGDDYVVNGTKLWQTHGHYADWMITLVRTSAAGKPQEGISCLLIDMRSAGVSVRPILTIGGDHEVNQIFLDDVRVPVANRIGGEGEGWAIAKHLLSVERGSSGNVGARLRWHLARVLEMIDAQPGEPDPAITARLATAAIDVDTVEMLELLALDANQKQSGSDITPSIIKLRGSVVEQALNQLAIDVLGEQALRWDDVRPLHHLDAPQDDREVLSVVPRYLNGRARTIFGGSTEVQLGIIAKSLGR